MCCHITKIDKLKPKQTEIVDYTTTFAAKFIKTRSQTALAVPLDTHTG